MKFKEFFFRFCKFLLIVAVLFVCAVVGYYFALFRVKKAQKNGGSVLVSRGVPFIYSGNAYEGLTEDSDPNTFFDFRKQFSDDRRTVYYALTPKYKIEDLELKIVLYDHLERTLESTVKEIGDVSKNETFYIEVTLTKNGANFDEYIFASVLTPISGTVTY